ncbi:MAG: type II toxin-antitoxin system prevent-host-death family antitoxin [Acidobacteria bacterium]|nr:type II toxin-antitoxin system prevent-host-death family antitoxin [Acidobacteriota bacterium]
MTSVGAYQAKTHLPELLDRVAKGERICITRHGVPVAVLHPPEGVVRRDLKQVIDEIRSFRAGRRVGWREIRSWIAEGRD